MTKTVLLTSSALVSFALATQAYSAEYQWSGFYIGGNVGGLFGDVDVIYPAGDNGTYLNPTPGDKASFSPDGVFGGAQLGYLHQFGDWVVGLEVEGRAMDFDETKLESFGGDNEFISVESEWGATATARFGFLLTANSLLYVKGGYAAGNVKVSHVDPSGTSSTTGSLVSDETHSGWVVGAGFEQMLGENVSAGLEYNYIDLGTHDASGIATGPGGGPVPREADVKMHTVSARLNWHLTWY